MKRNTRSHVIMVGGGLLAGTFTSSAAITWISSTESQPWRQMPSPSLVQIEEPPVVFVKPERPHQTIDGFGGLPRLLRALAVRAS